MRQYNKNRRRHITSLIFVHMLWLCLTYFPTSVINLSTPVNSFIVKLKKTGSYESISPLQDLLYLQIKVRSFDRRPGPSQASTASVLATHHRSVNSHRVVCAVLGRFMAHGSKLIISCASIVWKAKWKPVTF